MTRARKKLPYEGTGVSVSTSLAELQKILLSRKVAGFGYQPVAETGGLVVRFSWRSPGGRDLVARLVVDPSKARPRSSQQTRERARALEMMRLCRVLVYYVKVLLDAVAGGVLSLEEAMLAHVEDPGSGRTVAEIVGGPMFAALPPGRDG